MAQKSKAAEAEQEEVPFGEETETATIPLGEDNKPKYGEAKLETIEKEKEKKIPTVKMYDNYGKLEKKRRAIDIDISEQLLPPITRKSTAIYKLIPSWWNPLKPERDQADIKVLDPATGKEPDPRDLSFPGTYVLYDKWQKDPTKRQKTMINPGREQILENKEGDKYLKMEIKPVEFIADYCHIDVERNYLEYVFMENHPLNASNKNRPNKNIQPLFMRYDIHHIKSPESIMAEMDVAYEAERMVVDLKDRDRIIGIATSLNITTDGKKSDVIKGDLRVWARQHPREFFRVYGDVTPAIKMNVLDALRLGLIEYDNDLKSYVDLEDGETLHTVVVGEDPLESFIKRLKEEQEKYSIIKNMLDYWE